MTSLVVFSQIWCQNMTLRSEKSELLNLKKIPKLFYYVIFVYLKIFEDFCLNHQEVAFLMSRLRAWDISLHSDSNVQN